VLFALADEDVVVAELREELQEAPGHTKASAIAEASEAFSFKNSAEIIQEATAGQNTAGVVKDAAGQHGALLKMPPAPSGERFLAATGLTSQAPRAMTHMRNPEPPVRPMTASDRGADQKESQGKRESAKTLHEMADKVKAATSRVQYSIQTLQERVRKSAKKNAKVKREASAKKDGCGAEA